MGKNFLVSIEKENAHPECLKNTLFRVCKTKRTLFPFRRLPVSVYLYNSPNMSYKFQVASFKYRLRREEKKSYAAEPEDGWPGFAVKRGFAA